ncbi:MAG: hypothetical protein WCW17_00730 [Patescibacteria group bacterium]|jgi:hypothetical protein
MSDQLFTVMYFILFLASLGVVVMLFVVLYRANHILKNTEKVSTAVTDGLSKIIAASLNVVTVTKGIDKIIELLDKKFDHKKK